MRSDKKIISAINYFEKAFARAAFDHENSLIEINCFEPSCA
jgi:hypothetical protein